MAEISTTDSKQELIEVLSKGNVEFATGLYKQCIGKEENVFLSPFSISAALGMTLLGAQGATQRQMTEVMCLNQLDGPTAIYTAFEEAIRSIGEATQTGLTLLTANGLYVQDKFSVLPKYSNMLQKHFNAMIHTVDFMAKPAEVRAQINEFVETVTNNRIKDLIADGVIKENTRLILVNAIYFKGDWDKKFDADLTSKKPFKVSIERTETVDMMFQKSEFRYSKCNKLQCTMVELPYVGKRLGMFFLLPNKVDGLAQLEANFNHDNFQNLVDKSKKVDVNVSIPRFKIESSFELNTALDTMGMKDLFVPGRADLSGITTSEPLCVSAVIHKAFLEVNEEGSEAAAATAIEIMLCCYVPPEPEKFFVCDHPFLVLIRDNESGLILFMGRVSNPI